MAESESNILPENQEDDVTDSSDQKTEPDESKLPAQHSQISNDDRNVDEPVKSSTGSVPDQQTSASFLDLIYNYVNDLVQGTVHNFVHGIVLDNVSEFSDRNADRYIDYVLNVYRKDLHETQKYFKIVRSILAEEDVNEQLNKMLDSCELESEKRDSIKNVIDDILRDLLKHNIPFISPLTYPEKERVNEIVADSICNQKVKIQVRKLVLDAKRQFIIEEKQTYPSGEQSSESVFSDTYSIFPMKGQYALRRNTLKQHTDRVQKLSFTLPKIGINSKPIEIDKVTKTSVKHERPLGYSKFSAHLERRAYLAIPELYRLPKYTKAPLPRCMKVPVSSIKNAKIGYTSIGAPTLDFHEALTQVQAKLTKHYNSFK